MIKAQLGNGDSPDISDFAKTIDGLDPEDRAIAIRERSNKLYDNKIERNPNEDLVPTDTAKTMEDYHVETLEEFKDNTKQFRASEEGLPEVDRLDVEEIELEIKKSESLKDVYSAVKNCRRGAA